MSRAAWVVLVVFLEACATGSAEVRREGLAFEKSAPLEAGWKRVKTADFELLTNLEQAEAQRAAQLLSQSLAGLTAMFGQATPLLDRKLVVIALADGLEFDRRFGGPPSWGFASIAGSETTVCLYGAPDRWFVRPVNLVAATHSVLQHELAHAVLSRYFVQQPTWFAEGMAQYLETFRWLDPQTVQLGEPNLSAWRNYSAVRSHTLKDLLSWNSYQEHELETAGHYGLAWAFVHFAINREPQRFASLMADLVEERDDAFSRAFGEPTEALDRAVYAYLKQGQSSVLRLKVPLAAPTAVKLEAVAEPTARLRQLEEARSRAREPALR